MPWLRPTNYQISEDLLNKDIDKLKELGSLQALVDYHNEKQKENDKSVERVDQYLVGDPKFQKLQVLLMLPVKKPSGKNNACSKESSSVSNTKHSS